MQTIEDERLKLWHQANQAMSKGNTYEADLALETLGTNIQGIKKNEPYEEWKKFKDKLEKKREDAHKNMVKEIDEERMNPIEKKMYLDQNVPKIENWIIGKKHEKMYRILDEYNLLPTEKKEPLPRGEEKDLGS